MILADAVAHLSPERWETANRLLIRNALAEFAHERLSHPESEDGGYVVRSDDGNTAYRFAAVRPRRVARADARTAGVRVIRRRAATRRAEAVVDAR